MPPLLLVSLLVLAVDAAAGRVSGATHQSPPAAPLPPPLRGDSAVLATREQWIEDAVVTRHLDRLTRACARDVRFVHATGERQSRTQWLAEVTRSRFALRRVDSLDVEVHGDVALVTGRLHVRVAPEDPGWASDPEWREYMIRYARVYVRRPAPEPAAGWQLLTHHSFVSTLGPPVPLPPAATVRQPAG